jgi:hypothetical protein
MVKMTFTFDAETVETLRKTASRMRKPQSAVVREAIRDYADRADRLSDDEKRHMLSVLDQAMASPTERTAREMDTEIRSVRNSRKSGGRRGPKQ